MLLTKELKQPIVPLPRDFAITETSRLTVLLWEKEVTTYTVRRDYIESNLKALYAVIWGQCSEAMPAKIKSLSDFDSSDKKSDSVWLLKEIKAVMMLFEGQQYLHLSLDDAKTKY